MSSGVGASRQAPPPLIDFIVIGAQRSGTTSVRSYLESHPQLVLSRSKEAPYFSDPKASADGLEALARREFPRRKPGRKYGTVTPQYMAGGLLGPGAGDQGAEPERLVPGRIKAKLPDVRLIALLRDPIERCLSHFRLNVWDGRESRTLATAVAESLEPAALEAARAHPDELTGYVSWGEYGRLLEPYFNLFGRDQLLIELTSDLEAAAATVVTRIFGHVGVDPGYQPPGLGQRHHVSGEAWIGGDMRWKSTWRRILGGRHLPPNAPLWRRLIGSAGPSAERLREISAPDADVAARLRDHYREDRERLERLLGRELPWPRN